MPGKILPDSQLESWMRAGKTDAEIVRLLQKQENISVTRQAISAWRKRKGDDMRPQSPRAMPWRLRPEHRQLEPARVIRLYARRARGIELTPEDQARLDKAVAYLEEHNAVYHYEPTHPQGPWFAVPRREGVDTGITRNPDK